MKDSNNRAAGIHISADLPIKAKEEDRLNRSGFAEAIAKTIASWRNRPSLVIGLFGEWGSGKSSIKNMIVESLAENPDNPVTIVEFSPWQFSGQEMVTQAFFSELGKAIGKSNEIDDDTAKRRSARWKLYSSALSMFATVARTWQAVTHPADPLHGVATSASLALGGAAEVAKAGAEGVQAEESIDTISISELKAELSNDLSSLPRPLLVILDDIDRLTKEEIRLTLQLVKANADFPNIIYLLLAQREAVRNALNEIAPGNADQFMEKIIQVSFDIPAVNRRQLEALLLTGLNGPLSSPGVERRFSRKYWLSVSRHIIPLFRSIRDINRFLAGLAFHVELLRSGDTFEVNPVDLIALETLRFFEPDLYKRLPMEKEVLTLEPRWSRKEKRDQDKKRTQTLVASAAEQRRDAIQEILGEIFPPSGLSRGGNYSDDFENTWFQQLRVCSYQAFDRYFQLTTPEGDISQAEIDELIDSISSKEELDAIFARLVQKDLLDVMLARLSSLKETLPLENASTFLSALFDIKAPDRQYELLDHSPADRIIGITYWYLQRLDEMGRLETLTKALQDARHLGPAIITLGYFAAEPRRDGRYAPLLVNPESRETLKKACLDRIRVATGEDSGTSTDELLQVVGYWANWDKEAARSWILGFLDSRATVVKFFQGIQSTSNGTGGRREFIHVASFENIIPPNVLLEKIDAHLTGERTNDEKKLVEMLKSAIKRREEGTENNPFAIFQDLD